MRHRFASNPVVATGLLALSVAALPACVFDVEDLISRIPTDVGDVDFIPPDHHAFDAPPVGPGEPVPAEHPAFGQAPEGGVPCDVTDDMPVWLGFEIAAAHMSGGASDPNGAGRCEGYARFSDDGFDFTMMNEAQTAILTLRANGSTELFTTCDSPYHCGALLYGDGTVEEEYCTVYATCEDGLARSVGFTW